ncbi:hypothetical protein DR64_750 [Paraburkholderia xenovorans LB400]|uniref:Uncharacterized protein n=1 Tax=Paraburkholderia xenovorans (strain LB400) TaxID=266265 RepID=Q141T0_PARXL|nr:hypothetical protein [Paraburkholderia xenovorans]ABE29909.1 hypothetical protein Bxe_A3070 [Paraburkholderia xenovorans LB400]AIP30857.1 hypothetical protein DR64_750 [Paraburkholderia xenovorans LB400]
MTETTEMLFRTPQDAMRYAFSYAMQQRDRPLADRLAAPAARTGKGLHGNDGAGQAGMIRRELDQLSDIDRAVLVALFAPHSYPCSCGAACCSRHTPNPEYAAAITFLAEKALSQLSGHLSNYQLRRGLVEKALGTKITIKDLAAKCEVTEKTADAHWRIVRDWIGGTPKKKSKKAAKRERVNAGDGVADVARVDEEEDSKTLTAVDGIASKARKNADELLSALSFIRA